MDNIILFDLDNTLCDWDGAMINDLKRIIPPEFNKPHILAHWMGKERRNRPEWVEELMTVIRTQVGWWRNLPWLPLGRKLLNLVLHTEWEVNILTKGPATKPYAWAEKVEWCAKNIGTQHAVPVTVCADKSMVYGKALVDDYPPYIEKWLKFRPNGLVLMPAHDYNAGFRHPNLIRVRDEQEDIERAACAIHTAFHRVHGEPLNLEEL